MGKLYTPKIKAIIKKLNKDMKEQRLCVLQLEFYMYMEKQGYPDFWKICKGILYPTTVWNKDVDHVPKWHFNFKNGDKVVIPLDDENKKFQELHGKS